MLELINASKTYQKRKVVHNVSLKISHNEIIGLLGPNGAGKTTTFYLLVGLIAPDQGQVLFKEEDITSYPLYKRSKLGIGYLPQEPSIFRELSVKENIWAVLETRPIPYRQKKQILDSLIADFGLEKILLSKGLSLSGGERRRVEIARALSLSPEIILFDEPFAGVDPIAVNDLRDIIYQLKDKGISILITDHNVRETLGTVQKAYIMNQGEIIVEGSPSQVIENPLAKEFYLGEKFTF